MNAHIQRPTESELAILRVLWEHGPSTVRFVNEQLNSLEKEKEIGYTTTLKLMQIMYDKGLLTRKRKGKMHIYATSISEKETQRQLMDKLVDTAFHGSALKLVMQALGSHRTSKKELESIRNFLDELTNQENKDKADKS
jgi:BlaI family transcriptional regulator, penicillinase repressor